MRKQIQETFLGENPELDLKSRSCAPLTFLLKHKIMCWLSNMKDLLHTFLLNVYFTVVQGMKEAQERLTGDAFREKHLEDEL